MTSPSELCDFLGVLSNNDVFVRDHLVLLCQPLLQGVLAPASRREEAGRSAGHVDGGLEHHRDRDAWRLRVELDNPWIPVTVSTSFFWFYEDFKLVSNQH